MKKALMTRLRFILWCSDYEGMAFVLALASLARGAWLFNPHVDIFTLSPGLMLSGLANQVVWGCLFTLSGFWQLAAILELLTNAWQRAAYFTSIILWCFTVAIIGVTEDYGNVSTGVSVYFVIVLASAWVYVRDGQTKNW